MKIKEYGKSDKPLLIFIHGGGLSSWSWMDIIHLLEEEYDIKAIIIDGHGEDYETDFISIEDTAGKIREHLKANNISRVHGICGLSIGAQITVELLTSTPNLSENWLIESALVVPMKTITNVMLPFISLAYPLIKKKWYAKLQAKTLLISENDFELYFKDSSRMSLSTLQAVTISNGNYTLKSNHIESSSNILIFVGSKEPKIMIRSAQLLAHSIPNSKLEILEGYKHGELSLKQHVRYAEIIKGFKG